MLEESLTPEQVAFCNHYVKTGNASASYAKAFPERGAKLTSKKRSEFGNKLLENPQIKAYITLRDRPTPEIAEEILREEMLRHDAHPSSKVQAAQAILRTAKRDEYKDGLERWVQVLGALNVSVFKAVPRGLIEKMGK